MLFFEIHSSLIKWFYFFIETFTIYSRNNCIILLFIIDITDDCMTYRSQISRHCICLIFNIFLISSYIFPSETSSPSPASFADSTTIILHQQPLGYSYIVYFTSYLFTYLIFLYPPHTRLTQVIKAEDIGFIPSASRKSL